MGVDIILAAERITAATKAGLWGEKTLLDHFDAACRARPDTVAVTGYNSSRGRTETLSYRQLDRLSRRAAAGLARLGIEKGDVVSAILPNWCEFPLVHLACLRIGAVTNPLMPILRQRELGFMLKLAQSRVLIVPRSFRDFDYPGMISELRPDLPDLHHVLVVDGKGDDAFERVLLQAPEQDAVAVAALFAARRPDANEPIEILYTSGTTGEPKGVVHTSNTLLSSLGPCCKRLRLGAGDVVLMASPLAHQTGFVYGMMMAFVLGGKLVLQDIWNAERAASLIEDEGVSFTMASTPFLSDLSAAAAAHAHDLRSLRVFIAAGAPIPQVLATRAEAALGARIMSGWGMTENGLVTVTGLNDPENKVFGTDGRAFESMEVRVVGPEGEPLPANAAGRLQARGAGNFVGYLKRPQYYEMDADGWFETGDVATMDAEGYIRITGRSKDIIIRGGENIPVVEIEELIYRHPAVQSAAMVAMPDARLGERGCLFAVLQPGATLTFDEMVAYLDRQHVARNYFPERLEILAEMPRTASGKIQKYVLRERARALAANRD
jgi:cyclohexanecarboxylate-CoA ligase